MKNVISLLLVLVMCLSLCACGVSADIPVESLPNTEPPVTNTIPSVDSASILKEGTCEEGITYKLYDNGVLVVSGGEFLVEPFTKFNDYVQYIKVEEGITFIGNKVFADLKNCIMVELPSTLKWIDVAAFANCSALETVNLPDGLESIGKNAFYFAGLTSVEIPGSVFLIEEGAFSYCNLEEIIIHKGITEIPKDAFTGNNELTFVVIPGSVKYIGSGAFRSCDKLETVILCRGVESAGARAFENIKTLALPDSFQGFAPSNMGEPNPTNSSSTVYCNDSSYASWYYAEIADVIVGYDGFIKNYNLDGLHADKIEEEVDPATYYEAGKELRAQGNYAEAIASFELAGDYLDSTAQIAELEDLDMLLQGISSNQALSYFNDRLADYPAITGDEIRELVLNDSWRGFRTGKVWTFLENGTIDGASSDPNFTRSWRIDGNLLTYSGLAIDGVRFYSYAVHKVNEDGYLLVQDGQVSATMIRAGK